MKKYVIQYQRGLQELNTTVTIYTDPYAVANYEYERLDDEPSQRQIGKKIITFYRNYDVDTNLQYVSWIDDSAHYTIRGTVTEAEMDHIVALYTASPLE